MKSRTDEIELAFCVGDCGTKLARHGMICRACWNKLPERMSYLYWKVSEGTDAEYEAGLNIIGEWLRDHK